MNKVKFARVIDNRKYWLLLQIFQGNQYLWILLFPRNLWA